MTGNPGYTKKVAISQVSPVSFNVLPAQTASLPQLADVLDDTDFDTVGWHSRLLGLQDWSISANLVYTEALTGLTDLLDAWQNKTQLLARYLPDGATLSLGYKGLVYVQNLNINSDVGGLLTLDCTLVSAGALQLANA